MYLRVLLVCGSHLVGCADWWGDHGSEWSLVKAAHGCRLMDPGRSKAGSMWVGSTASLGPGSLALSPSAMAWEARTLVALFLGFFSTPNCVIVYRHAFASRDQWMDY